MHKFYIQTHTSYPWQWIQVIICLISEEVGSYCWRLKRSVWWFHSLHSNCISRPDLYTNTECYYYFQLYFHLLLSARVFIIVASIFSLTVNTSLHSSQQKCDQFAKYLSNSRSEPQHSSFSTIARGWRCISIWCEVILVPGDLGYHRCLYCELFFSPVCIFDLEKICTSWQRWRASKWMIVPEGNTMKSEITDTFLLLIWDPSSRSLGREFVMMSVLKFRV